MKQKLGHKERQKSQASSQALDKLLKNELNSGLSCCVYLDDGTPLFLFVSLWLVAFKSKEVFNL